MKQPITELAAKDAPRDGLIFVDLKGERRGYCYACGRIGFKVKPDARLSRHGFTRPRWQHFETGSCYGSGMTPEETLDVAIDLAARRAENLAKLLAGDLKGHAIARLRMENALNGRLYAWSSYRGSPMRRETATRIRAIRSDSVPFWRHLESWTPAGCRAELEREAQRNAGWRIELFVVKASRPRAEPADRERAT